MSSQWPISLEPLCSKRSKLNNKLKFYNQDWNIVSWNLAIKYYASNINIFYSFLRLDLLNWADFFFEPIVAHIAIFFNEKLYRRVDNWWEMAFDSIILLIYTTDSKHLKWKSPKVVLLPSSSTEAVSCLSSLQLFIQDLITIFFFF